jgi:nitrate reductase assembly molybdenum cofactor insertion protein NarJ
MVYIKKEQIRAGTDCGSELPDHLTNILMLLSQMKDEALAEELIYSMLIPALGQMILKFRDKKNHYKDLLEILKVVMEKDYPSSSYEKFNFPVRTKKAEPEGMQKGTD